MSVLGSSMYVLEMFSPYLKRFFIFTIVLANGFILTGCTGQSNAWVNTNSLPGHTFKKYSNYSQQYNSNSSGKNFSPDFGAPPVDKNINFGPKDVSFDFKTLNR